VGSFHKVSDKYLPLYVAEFQFRYNDGASRMLRRKKRRPPQQKTPIETKQLRLPFSAG
jgi:hypothetical protein